MAAVQDHYANHLADIYLWMAGGLDAAVAMGARDLAEFIPGNGLAVDLGAGFGMHSVPLARGGYEVLAIDTSAALLQRLSAASAGLPIQSVEGDLLEFRKVLSGPANLVVCMGDTLTHLQAFDKVEALCEDVKRSLAPGGHFVSVFRDYSAPAKDEERFIPVRDDPDRILTCFVEEEQTHMKIHDIVHERSCSGWSMRVSSYRKLRLPPAQLEATLRKLGLCVRRCSGPRGMVSVQASAMV